MTQTHENPSTRIFSNAYSEHTTMAAKMRESARKLKASFLPESAESAIQEAEAHEALAMAAKELLNEAMA